MIYGSNENMAATVNGDMYSWSSIRAILGEYQNATLGFPLPKDVPVKLKVTIEGLDNPNDLAYLNLIFQNLGNQSTGNITLTR